MASFVSSYIPTVASQVTRAADNASMIGNNFARWYNVNEGAAYVECGQTQGASAPFARAFSIASTAEGGSQISCSYEWGMRVRVVTTDSATLIGNTTLTNSKRALAYKVNDFATSNNAGTVATDNSGDLPVVNVLYLGANTQGTGAYLNGNIKRVSYFNRRLANTELTALTS